MQHFPLPPPQTPFTHSTVSPPSLFTPFIYSGLLSPPSLVIVLSSYLYSFPFSFLPLFVSPPSITPTSSGSVIRHRHSNKACGPAWTGTRTVLGHHSHGRYSAATTISGMDAERGAQLQPLLPSVSGLRVPETRDCSCVCVCSLLAIAVLGSHRSRHDQTSLWIVVVCFTLARR